MNTLLLVGGNLCLRTAKALAPTHWKCIGLRRNPVHSEDDDSITWYRADLQDPASLSFLSDATFSEVSHILYAPSPDGRTATHYESIYSHGLTTLLSSLPPHCVNRLKRCILVGSSAVWAPSEDWINEDSPVQATDFRARALLEAEAALQATVRQGAGVTLRLSGLYGPGRMRLLEGLRAGTITVPDGPGHWANRIHIDDAARACAHLLALCDPQPLYIGTDNCPLPTSTLYDAVAKHIGVPAAARKSQAPSGKRLSNTRLRTSGWEPVWPNALDWYERAWSESKR
ncbi:NAD-dependent epimerase/dehydratase family protein [Pollutimonas harenae]|uniref:NAD-dependent epimerase/dehydratase family protein n=1 Tax=Pollutimonas harenae TaxID=657015 RepID=A0A853H349_9BURK|nr:NAD-dependent epimerase/dehydratase family protein [Pollutimonas harenae]NYT84983.1 NAD-dependent epimerase/dehydratase family protein [Pollutimonas harenae]TEA72628.1 NAD-dependent epimerase/dehydratase family protein [Pollutimonas harenae]